MAKDSSGYPKEGVNVVSACKKTVDGQVKVTEEGVFPLKEETVQKSMSRIKDKLVTWHIMKKQEENEFERISKLLAEELQSRHKLCPQPQFR